MDQPHFSDEHIVEALEEHGYPWQEYILVGERPSICRWSAGQGLWGLIIEDDSLARATADLLSRRGVRRVASMEELKAALGWDGIFRPDGTR